MDQWLYRQSDLILGPVPTNHLVDKLYKGEVGASTEVQMLGSSLFRKMVDVPEFKVHVAKAEAKKRVDAHADKHHTEQRRKLIIALSVAAGVVLVLGAIVALAGRYLAVHTPATKSAEEIAWGDISIDAPTITRAKRRDDDELIDYPGATKRPGGTLVAQRPAVDPKDPKPPEKNPGATPGGTTPKPRMGTADPDGMQMGEVDQGAINDVIARNRPKLIPCLKAVTKPGMVAKIPIEFSITEAGKVSKVWVDNPDFKTGPLPECLLQELQKWPFKASPGGGATVQLSFNIGKRG